jgi:hypothetical protein
VLVQHQGRSTPGPTSLATIGPLLVGQINDAGLLRRVRHQAAGEQVPRLACQRAAPLDECLPAVLTKKPFARRAGHDMRTPLQSILMTPTYFGQLNAVEKVSEAATRQSTEKSASGSSTIPTLRV